MQVTWERTWPRWVGVACAMFGFANIAGALIGPFELWFPGVVIGSVWGGRRLERGSADIRLRAPNRGLPIGKDLPRPPERPSSQTSGLPLPARLAPDRGHHPSAGPGEVCCHGLLLDRAPSGRHCHDLDAQCLSEVWPVFPSCASASVLRFLEPV